MAITIANNVVNMTAAGDLFPAANLEIRPNFLITGVRVANPTAGKYYILRHYTSSGNKFWDSGVLNSTDPVSDYVTFTSGGGVYLDTDDAGTNFVVQITIGA